MPVLDGLEAARAIRAEEDRQGLARVPIIALSADAMAHQVKDHLAAGMDGHVAKPIKIPALLGAIAAALEAGAPPAAGCAATSAA
jgi:CheY-like chemotaxis protein